MLQIIHPRTPYPPLAGLRVSQELPSGEEKEPPIKIPKKEQKQNEEERADPTAQSGKPPNWGSLKATKQGTASGNGGNDGDAVEVEVVTTTKPSGPPPKPQAKPSGPPPIPKRG